MCFRTVWATAAQNGLKRETWPYLGQGGANRDSEGTFLGSHPLVLVVPARSLGPSARVAPHTGCGTLFRAVWGLCSPNWPGFFDAVLKNQVYQWMEQGHHTISQAAQAQWPVLPWMWSLAAPQLTRVQEIDVEVPQLTHLPSSPYLVADRAWFPDFSCGGAFAVGSELSQQVQLYTVDIPVVLDNPYVELYVAYVVCSALCSVMGIWRSYAYRTGVAYITTVSHTPRQLVPKLHHIIP